MTLRGTIILVFLAIGMIAWLIFQPEQRPRLDAPLFHAEASKISIITIADGNDIRTLKKNKNRWVIDTTPLDRADLSEVTRLLTAICDVKPVDILNKKELKNQLSLSSLGLENTKRSLTIHQEGIKDQTLYFGNEAVGDKRFFARLKDRPEVFIIPSTLTEIAFSPSNDFRDHSLTELEVGNLEQIYLERGDGKFRALFKNGQWEMLQPIKASLNNQAVETWCSSILKARIQARIDSDTPDLSNYGLEQPRAKITFFEKESAAPIILSLGKNAEDNMSSEEKFVYLSSSARHCILKMPENIEKLFMISPDSLRSHQFFNLNLDTVDQIIITKGETTITLQRQKDASEDWISDTRNALVISGPQMQEMINALKTLPVISFESATSQHLSEEGLKAPSGPAARIRFIAHLSENTPDDQAGDYAVLQIAFGSPETPTSSTLFAHIDSNPDIDKIPATVLNLPLLNLGEKKK